MTQVSNRLRQIQPAVRRGRKARVALAGPSGSGKTWTALTIAQQLADGGDVLVIDTERSSAGLYADRFPFKVLDWQPPYDPREVAQVIEEVGSQYAVLVVDSLSHYWEGSGGTRDIVDAAAARAQGNSFAGWKTGTPAQNDLVAALIGAPCHVIGTMRSKTEYVLETNDRGRQVPKKVGMAPIQRAGIEYEFTVVGDLDLEHRMTITKTRCSLLADKVFRAQEEGKMAKVLFDWLDSAEEPAAPVKDPDRITTEAIIADQLRAIPDSAARLALMKNSGYPAAQRPAVPVTEWLESLDDDVLGGLAMTLMLFGKPAAEETAPPSPPEPPAPPESPTPQKDAVSAAVKEAVATTAQRRPGSDDPVDPDEIPFAFRQPENRDIAAARRLA